MSAQLKVIWLLLLWTSKNSAQECDYAQTDNEAIETVSIPAYMVDQWRQTATVEECLRRCCDSAKCNTASYIEYDGGYFCSLASCPAPETCQWKSYPGATAFRNVTNGNLTLTFNNATDNDTNFAEIQQLNQTTTELDGNYTTERTNTLQTTVQVTSPTFLEMLTRSTTRFFSASATNPSTTSFSTQKPSTAGQYETTTGKSTVSTATGTTAFVYSWENIDGFQNGADSQNFDDILDDYLKALAIQDEQWRQSTTKDSKQQSATIFNVKPESTTKSLFEVQVFRPDDLVVDTNQNVEDLDENNKQDQLQETQDINLDSGGGDEKHPGVKFAGVEGGPSVTMILLVCLASLVAVVLLAMLIRRMSRRSSLQYKPLLTEHEAFQILEDD